MDILFRNGGKAVSDPVKTAAVLVGSYTVVAADDSAGSAVINLSDAMPVVEGGIVRILRSGKLVSSDTAVAFGGTAGTLTVGDGSTFALTTGDIVNYIVWGSQAN